MIGEEEKIALLIDELEDIRCDNFDADTDEDKTLKEAIRVIKAPKQETGHWIKFVVNRQHKIRCNKCNYVENEYITHIRNYCPNCGAKMEESEGEKDEQFS